MMSAIMYNDTSVSLLVINNYYDYCMIAHKHVCMFNNYNRLCVFRSINRLITVDYVNTVWTCVYLIQQ